MTRRPPDPYVDPATARSWAWSVLVGHQLRLEAERAMTRSRSALAVEGWCRDAGQGLVEYGLILMLVTIVAILSLAFFGSNVSGMISTVGKSV